MQIEDSELYFFVKPNGDGTYDYSLKEGEKEEVYLDTVKQKPSKLKPRSEPRKAFKSKIEKLITPTKYDDLGINVYINNLMVELQKELKVKEDNQKPVYEGEYTEYAVKGYVYKDDRYWKTDFRNGELIYEHEVLKGKVIDFARISDYSHDTINHYKITILDQSSKDGIPKKYFFYDSKDNIVESIVRNDLGWNKYHVKDFIYKLTYTFSVDNTEQGVVGGYSEWDNIQTVSKKKLRDISELTNYFKNKLSKKHLEVIKSLMLIPFHWILRQDNNYMGRGIIKFVVLHGAPSAFKNGIVNIVRNMFDFYSTIPIDASGTPNTYASLRNSINDNIGFVLCDESDNAFIDENKKFKSQSDSSVENLLKMVFQEGMPSVSEETGKNLKQKFRGTPIFIWNDDFKKTKALEDRCIVLCFEKQFEIDFENFFDINYYKKDLLYFGNVFASCLKEHWEDELRKIRDYEELINTVFKYMAEEYNIDTSFLIDTKIDEENEFLDIFDIFYNRMHSKFHEIHNVEHYVNETGINNDVFDKMKVDFIKTIGKTDIYVNKNRFINYIKYHVAKDGGLLIEQIEKKFDLGEVVKRENVECYKINIEDFLDNINKHGDDKEEKVEKEETQSRIL